MVALVQFENSEQQSLQQTFILLSQKRLKMSDFDEDPFPRRSRLSQLSRLDDRILDMGGVLSSLSSDVNSLLREIGSTRTTRTTSSGTSSILSNIETNADGQRKYVVNLPLGSNVRPEDVKISIKDNIVTVESKREEKSNDGNSRLYQEYVRKFNLPSSVNAAELKSELLPEGTLRLEALLPKEEKPEEKKEEPQAPKTPQPIPIAIE